MTNKQCTECGKVFTCETRDVPTCTECLNADVCAYEDCEEAGTVLAYSRITEKVGRFCKKHSEIVLDELAPEYVASCPNCKCLFGVA